MEANRRRKPVENLNPKLAQNCSEEIIEILDRKLELRIYRPNERQGNHAIIYFHGGGFVMCHAKMYRLFLSNLGNKQIKWILILELGFVLLMYFV